MNKRIRQIEEEYGVDFGVKNDIQLSTYLRRIGLPSLAKLLRRVSHKSTRQE